ncbi:U-box domain-containing protein [Thalictrum thalictroides]|uniref:RING-type E3 ubiquitin transferase n=1 Tax=Thalictrum thalictroides TaxID=46969 RepID=A0A7J6X7M2_THATH|nr:U-box domain-containing protein [Thalictrum thalictroides]
MAGYYKFSMDQKDIVRSLIAAVGSFIQDRLINKEQRLLHKEQCAERLAAEDGSCGRDSEVRYSEQAVLANLDWGIDALEEAINTSNVETKLARLDYAEKMLQVCAMLNSRQKTAGVPNFYLSAWSHLYLAFLWKLRNNVRNSVLHILEMFIIDPFFSRIDFAPELWKTMFLPHMSSIVGWYSESRHRLVMEVIPDSADLSFTADFDQFFNESIIFSMRPDQAEKLQTLEQLYGQSLDENTKLYAKYYKDCMNSDATSSKRVVPMLPIAEPPMTPLHEVSRSIPDYVKFGPILPKSAGFSPFLKEKEECRLNTTLSAAGELEHKGSTKENSFEENERDYCSEDGELDIDSEVKILAVPPNNLRIDDAGTKTKYTKSKNMEWKQPSPLFSPISSPKTPSNFSTPSPSLHSKNDSEPLLRLCSSRITNITSSTSVPGAPCFLPEVCISPAGSDGQVREVKKSYVKGSSFGRNTSFGNHNEICENSYVNECEEEGSQGSNSIPSSGKLTPLNRPPKDFVCPITRQLLNDPVTLETGQTYERKAIQEWLKRGNTTCPNTRQPLSANALPKTNYVLKRLITSWKEQYPDIAQEFSYSSETPKASISSTSSREPQVDSSPSMIYTRSIPRTVDHCINKQKSNRFLRAAVSTSPTSVISQAASEAIINGIKAYTSCLCTSEDLQECEEAVLTIARTWKDSKVDSGLHSFLSKPTIVNGLAEILLASVNREVLVKSIYILSNLIFADENVGETLTSVSSDFDCLTTLLKNGLAEAAVLIYQLNPAYAQLSLHDLIPSLVQVILSKTEDLEDFRFVMDPKDAAVALLEQLLIGGDESSRSLNAQSVISANGLPYLIKCLDRFEGRRSVVSILLSSSHVQLAPVLELFHAGDDTVRGICIDFFSELVCLNRRTFCNQILQIIKDEGGFSTMHTFLVYLQMAPMEQQPAIASLLLQLDLLVCPNHF